MADEFRLHLDCPLGANEEEAIRLTTEFINNLRSWLSNEVVGISRIDEVFRNGIQIRLGFDGDRQRSNYLDKNANGHVSTKKCKLV